MVKREIRKILLILILLAGLVIGVILVRERQEVRKKAAEQPASLSLYPSGKEVTPLSEFTLSLYLNTGGLESDGAELFLHYDNSFLEVLDITKGEIFDLELYKEIKENQVIYSLGSLEKRFNGTDVLATLSLKAKENLGETTISFDMENSKVISGLENILGSSSGTRITLLEPSPTPQPTVEVSPTPTETPTPSPREEPTPTPTLTPTITPTTTPPVGGPPTETPPPLPTSEPTITPTISPTPPPDCEQERKKGNYDCDKEGAVNLQDFEVWKEEYLEGKSALRFFEYWRRAFFK